MAQARRIKAKPAKKKKASTSSVKRLPWGLLLVVLVCGVVLGLLISGSKTGDATFGSGLKALFQSKQSHVNTDPDITELIERKSTDELNLDFYELLPEIEKVMPGDLPEATSIPVAVVDYYLQAASFREHADAEKLRASLALQGYKSVTQARDVEGKGRFFRVRLGPYENKRKANTAKNKLQKLGVRPFVYTVNKES